MSPGQLREPPPALDPGGNRRSSGPFRQRRVRGRRLERIGGRAARRFDRETAGTRHGRGTAAAHTLRSGRFWVRRRLFPGGERFQDVTRDSPAIADRVPMGAGPFAHCRRVPRTAAAAPSLRRRRPIGGFRGCAGAAGSTTRSQPPTCSGQLIEVGLAQVEFVAGGAVVHSNRRHGLGAVTMKIARKHDTRCLGHNSSLQRPTSDGPLARDPNTNDRPISPRSG
jgi:hypothetical protein